VIFALKSNRCLNEENVRTHNQHLKHQRYKRVILAAADDRLRTYLVRQVDGRLNDTPFDVRVFISKSSRTDRSPRYFMSTDLSLSAYQVLSRYMKRWPCEVANWYLKTRLGLGDFRMRSFESIEKFFVLTWLALAFLEWRLATAQQPQTRNLADVIRRQRHQHARRTLRAACEMAIHTGDVDSVLERFAPALT
jgi:IS4 transposase